MKQLFIYIYAQPMDRIIRCMLLLILIWSTMNYLFNDESSRWKDKAKIWKSINVVVLCISIMVILIFTLFDRKVHTDEVILVPFYSFQEARIKPEIYRSMLMNVFLFVPLGLSLPNVLPKKSSMLSQSVLTMLLTMGMSGIIEFLQFWRSIGRCEIDDVIMNTLGALLGTVSYVLGSIIAGCSKEKGCEPSS